MKQVWVMHFEAVSVNPNFAFGKFPETEVTEELVRQAVLNTVSEDMIEDITSFGYSDISVIFTDEMSRALMLRLKDSVDLRFTTSSEEWKTDHAVLSDYPIKNAICSLYSAPIDDDDDSIGFQEASEIF